MSKDVKFLGDITFTKGEEDISLLDMKETLDDVDNKIETAKLQAEDYTDTKIQEISESGFVPTQSDWEAENTTENGGINYAYIKNKPTLGEVAGLDIVPIEKGGTGATTVDGILNTLKLSSGLTSSGEFTSVSTMKGLDAGVYLVRYFRDYGSIITGIAYIDPNASINPVTNNPEAFHICTFNDGTIHGGLMTSGNSYELIYVAGDWQTFIINITPMDGTETDGQSNITVQIRRII